MDVRREPPIPVERAIEAKQADANSAAATERVMIDKMSKETGKNLEEKANENSVPDTGKVSTLATLADTKNENLIDSEAIKKEESELAAALDQADIEVAARREKLRRTLEKHKLEQLKMMQEQKELLKDIKEQKEEFRMEKKRLAQEKKDEAKKLLPTEKESNELAKNEAEKLNSVDLRANEKSVAAPIGLEESRGPILNALTNWTSKRNSSSDILPEKNNRAEEAPVDRDSSLKSDIITKNKSMEIMALPIALKLRNQTTANEAPLVEGRDRKKRESVDNENSTDFGEKFNLINAEHDAEQCQNIDEKSANFISPDIIPTTHNLYLAEQPLPGANADADVTKLKKRDLKALRIHDR